MERKVQDLNRYLPMIYGTLLVLGGIAVTVVAFWLLIRQGAGVVERHGLHRERFRDLARYDAETAMRGVSNALCDIADGAQARAVKSARSLAVLIDPENPKAAFALATDYYGAKRFAEARDLLERALPLFEQSLEAAQHRDALPGDTAEQAGGRQGELYKMIERAVDMYEDCMGRV